jgi:hypothetical protein
MAVNESRELSKPTANGQPKTAFNGQSVKSLRSGSMSDKTITISLDKYEDLVADSDWLRCLEQAGVDDWEGVDYAAQLFREMGQTEDE